MRCLIIYFSKYGQTEKIASRIGDSLAAKQISPVLHNVAHLEQSINLKPFDGVVVGAPIYLTKHSKRVARFVKTSRDELDRKVTAFYSVSLSEAGDAQQKQDAAKVIDAFLSESGWQPALQQSFAGGLPYRKYNWLIRWLMKRMVRKSGGDTDTSRDYEYTNWNRVDEFALEFSSLFTDAGNIGNKTEKTPASIP